MHLFVSDIHFGRFALDQERETERDLIRCLRSVSREVEVLYLVGDVFEHYIEYRHLIPKGFLRFQALLAEWTDAGVPVKYFAGNHDPWHRDYFEKELGVEVILDAAVIKIDGETAYVTHGDGLEDGTSLYAKLKPVLRHPLPVGIFTGLLPADAGLAIARWYSRTFRHNGMNARRVADLRAAALAILAKEETGLIILGHSHKPELLDTGHGIYLNPGCWYADRTVAIIDNGKASLKQWNGECLQPYPEP